MVTEIIFASASACPRRCSSATNFAGRCCDCAGSRRAGSHRPKVTKSRKQVRAAPTCAAYYYHPGEISMSSVYGFEAGQLTAKPALSDFRTKVMLIVNTTKPVRFTPRFGGLEALLKSPPKT
jgi:hypothetical protein